MRDGNWDQTWVAVSYGFKDDGVTPLYSSRFAVATTNNNSLKLQLDNDFFRFVIQDEEHPTPTLWPEQEYDLEPGTHNFFYWVVPKDNSIPSSAEASIVSVRLVALPTGSAPYLIPISHDYPGDSAHSRIRYRRVSPADYEANKDNRYTADGVTAYWIEPKN